MADPGFPVGGVDPLRGRGPPTRCLSVKMHAKTKELGPFGGRASEIFVCRSATAYRVLELSTADSIH